MDIITGVDLVDIKDFTKSLKNGNVSFTSRVFHQDELTDLRIEHLAGIFAAKEAVMKAFNLPTGSWLDIHVYPQKSGKPVVSVSGKNIYLSDLSISHTKGLAVAFFVAFLK